MKSLAVRDLQGRHWKVSVRMLPWGLKWRGPRTRKDRPGDTEEKVPTGRWYDGLDIADLTLFDEGLGGFVAVLLFIVAIAIGVLFILPAFIFLIEVLIVALLVLGTILLRVVFRQPWLVDAVASDGTRMTWKVVGYRNSRRVVDEIGGLIARGASSPTVHDAVLVR